MTLIFLAFWSSFFWVMLSIGVFVVSFLLIGLILIQDSKDTGLTSAFGGSGSSSALLGARMQKDLARFTAILAGILAVLVIILGLMSNFQSVRSVAGETTGTAATPAALPGPGDATGALLPPVTGTTGEEPKGFKVDVLPPGTGTLPPATPGTPAPGAPAPGTPTPGAPAPVTPGASTPPSPSTPPAPGATEAPAQPPATATGAGAQPAPGAGAQPGGGAAGAPGTPAGGAAPEKGQ